MRQESDPVFFHSLKTHIWCEDKILRSKQMKKKNLNLNKARTVKMMSFIRYMKILKGKYSIIKMNLRGRLFTVIVMIQTDLPFGDSFI